MTLMTAHARELQQGQQWRSSSWFIVTAMAMALFTDTFLYTFLVPILPYVVETRLGLDASLTQRISFALLSESSLVAVVLNPFIGHYADKSESKRVWLLSALVAALLGSIYLAVANSVFDIFMSRLIQAIASAFMWVIGYATIADCVAPERLGMIYGVISVAAGVGLSGGPLASGVLFKLGGYWLAWSSAFVILAVDIVLRLLMVENPRRRKEKQAIRPPANDDPRPEETPLLYPDDDPSPAPDASAPAETMVKSGWQYYVYVFQHRGFVGGVLGFFAFAILISSFDTTLPLHVRDVFGWDSMPTGLMFLALQGPSIALSPFIGWLKDRVGTRIPTTVGFSILAPLMWLLGVPGDERFPWANQGQRGQVIYAVDVTAVGIVSCLLNGVGTIEVTKAIDDIQTRHPGIFGPHGGYSRAISICSMGWTIGAFLGPILSGYLVETIGYYEMTGVIAVLCAASAVNAFLNLGSQAHVTHGSPNPDPHP
ncbi:putative MFS multidrug transporter [Aspergillus clavatus NRRL 1]|uniref:MFS multidrug transporter, putative n=1 Tax=Aspergillus clavatus (strain ATCC 1007 / CBS 513.65 / DSM 816 / NCTC 3887 / NRRL 1 / QM 1276 / 107) TaxID=344612 RepID=A1CFS0_ASPCL|nr:MFS multidrug transporter, putative [Aspergillus clavatus NRRL 1]EAW11719.1 MFS multidrug transporter, putative [Aspergillus clavatus NRRL 1]